MKVRSEDRNGPTEGWLLGVWLGCCIGETAVIVFVSLFLGLSDPREVATLLPGGRYRSGSVNADLTPSFLSILMPSRVLGGPQAPKVSEATKPEPLGV